MHIRKGAFPDKFQTLGKLFLGLSREGHDHVRGNGTIAKILIQQADRFQIPGGIVLPLHSLQYGVTAGLHGQMELRAQVRKFT